jgi:hypothetical protein
MATKSPTQLSLAKLREEGYTCWITEHWNPWSKTRQDLFGFIDILALKKNETLAIQTTTATNLNARVKKISNHENVGAVRDAGWSIQCHGWFQDDKRKYHCKVKDVS